MAGGGSASAGGLSRYHLIGLLVPLLAAVSPMWLSRLSIPLPQPLVAVVAGVIVAALCYVVFRFVPYLKEAHALGKAVLLGALATEVLIFHASKSLPTMTTITLFLFFYFNSVETLP